MQNVVLNIQKELCREMLNPKQKRASKQRQPCIVTHQSQLRESIETAEAITERSHASRAEIKIVEMKSRWSH